MKRAILINKEKIEIQEIEFNESIGEDEVLIQTKVVTICGSDVRYFCMEELPYDLSYPLILGHEAAGIILKTGKNVKHLKKGDRVCIEPGIWCGKCDSCQNNQYNFCSDMKFMASKGFSGALQEKFIWPAKCVYRLNSEDDFARGALVEPTSVAYSAIEKIELKHKKSILILGAGSVGFLAAKLISKLSPEIDITFSDIWENRVQLGKKMGFREEQFLIRNQRTDKKFDGVIDTVAGVNLIKKFYDNLKPEATIVLVGISENKMDLSFKQFISKGLKIHSSYRYSYTYPKLLNGMMQEMENVITHRYPLEQVQAAFKTAAHDNQALKVMIEF